MIIQKVANNIFFKAFKQQNFKFSNYIKHCIQETPKPYQLNIQESDKIPILERKDDNILINQWWSQTPFDMNKPLIVPVFSFHSGQYLQKTVELEKNIFNVPLRRDIVHRVTMWRQKLFLIKTVVAKTKGTAAGSGIKPRPQKGTGRARLGNKRAPGRKGGGKAHGPVMRFMRQSLNKKIRLQGLKIMLSAKLAEGKLRIIDTEKLEDHKTKNINHILNQDLKSKILIIHGYTPDKNFQLSRRNIKRLQSCLPNRLNILKLLRSDRIFITLEGLQELVQDLLDRTYLRYKHRFYKTQKIVSIEHRKSLSNEDAPESEPVYDPSKPLDLKFQILQDYLKRYEELRSTGELEKYKDNYHNRYKQ